MAGAGVGDPNALVAALVELDRHVGRNGWDTPPRLFALVLSNVLAAAEPQLSAELAAGAGVQGGRPPSGEPRATDAAPGALTAIEQDEFISSGDLTRDLAHLEWPETVYGCALATVQMFLPADTDVDLPADPEAAAEAVASHPQRQEIRVVVGADRAGNRHGVARLAAQPDELLGAPDLVPGLAAALAHTLS
ncbi:MAG TPA: PPA1309 family protein [Propionibacteriaceae bacterium]|nr:PPA1309 family protein [Propionibacteriaceae bacterium]